MRTCFNPVLCHISITKIVWAAAEACVIGVALDAKVAAGRAEEMAHARCMRIVASDAYGLRMIRDDKRFRSRASAGLVTGDALAAAGVDLTNLRGASIAMKHVARAARASGRRRHAEAILFIGEFRREVVVCVEDGCFSAVAIDAELTVRQFFGEHESLTLAVVQFVA